jgi:hypothetical protein
MRTHKILKSPYRPKKLQKYNLKKNRRKQKWKTHSLSVVNAKMTVYHKIKTYVQVYTGDFWFKVNRYPLV